METVDRGDCDERTRAQVERAQEQTEAKHREERDPPVDDREDQGGQDDAAGLAEVLDQERLQDGQRWELTIVKAMLHTFIFVPIVSAGSVGGMTERFEAAPGKVDYVLLEWMLALELHERGAIKRIYPLVLGEEDVGHAAFTDLMEEPKFSLETEPI